MKKDFNINKELYIINQIGRRIVGSQFVIDDFNREVIIKLIFYFQENKNCENYNLKLNKGILLVGSNGTGKTKLIRIFRMYYFHYQRKGWIEISAKDAVSLYQINGMEALDKYMNAKDYNPVQVYIDDLGSEPIFASYFGTKVDVIKEILNSRYRQFEKGKLTFATTNLDTSDLKARYGERIYSRMSEMYNFIYIQGEDRRMKNI